MTSSAAGPPRPLASTEIKAVMRSMLNKGGRIKPKKVEENAAEKKLSQVATKLKARYRARKNRLKLAKEFEAEVKLIFETGNKTKTNQAVKVTSLIENLLQESGPPSPSRREIISKGIKHYEDNIDKEIFELRRTPQFVELNKRMIQLKYHISSAEDVRSARTTKRSNVGMATFVTTVGLGGTIAGGVMYKQPLGKTFLGLGVTLLAAGFVALLRVGTTKQQKLAIANTIRAGSARTTDTIGEVTRSTGRKIGNIVTGRTPIEKLYNYLYYISKKPSRYIQRNKQYIARQIQILAELYLANKNQVMSGPEIDLFDKKRGIIVYLYKIYSLIYYPQNRGSILNSLFAVNLVNYLVDNINNFNEINRERVRFLETLIPESAATAPAATSTAIQINKNLAAGAAAPAAAKPAATAPAATAEPETSTASSASQTNNPTAEAATAVVPFQKPKMRHQHAMMQSSWPGMMQSSWPGMMQQQPGMMPSQMQPGMMPSQMQPGMMRQQQGQGYNILVRTVDELKEIQPHDTVRFMDPKTGVSINHEIEEVNDDVLNYIGALMTGAYEFKKNTLF